MVTLYKHMMMMMMMVVVVVVIIIIIIIKMFGQGGLGPKISTSIVRCANHCSPGTGQFLTR